MTKEKKRMMITGGLFLLTVILAIWGINFLKGQNFLSRQTKLYSVYHNVKELTGGNRVYVSGKVVGKVISIEFDENALDKLVVEFHINPDIKIPKGSIAKISAIDLMGTKGLRILPNHESREYYTSGDTLPSAVETSLSEEVNLQLLPLKQKTESMLGTLDSLLISFRSVFNPQTRRDIKESFSHIRLTLRNLKQTSGKLDDLMTSEGKRISEIIINARSITRNLKNNNENISKILDNFSNISDTLAAANFANIIHRADQSITKFSKIMAQVEKGEGTLGQLLKDKSLYEEMSKAAKDLDNLLIDFNKNPGRYIHFSAFHLGRRVVVPDTVSRK